MTDLGDMLATEHNRLATRGASRYAQSGPDDGAGPDHHEGQDMREYGLQVIGIPAGMLGHDCSEHEGESAAAYVDAKRDQLRAEIDAATTAFTATVTRLNDKLAALDAIPTDNPARDGDVVSFKLTMPFRGERREYSYVGQVANGAYYLTGQDNEPKTWPELVEFLSSGPRRLVPGSFVVLNRPAVESTDTASTEPAAS